jgi:hypothetical protein
MAEVLIKNSDQEFSINRSNNKTIMKELFQNDYLILALDESLSGIIFKIGPLPSSSEVFREGCRNLVRFSQLYTVKSVLVDARGFMGALYDDVEWGALNVTPRLIQAGIKKLAFLGLENNLMKLAVQEHLELTASAPIEQQIFQSELDAKTWLMLPEY